ncbi:hypothetical protein BY458DRAFT_306667 [Sporodiniella umbellata]|nr:hypothetical protein BY458DRAFT_306667 [Sporodiniella umbellata]
MSVKGNKVVIKTPKRIWSSSKSHLSAIDASIGQCGEVIVCTVSGNVFIGQPGGNGYTFREVPYLQRCIRVCSNSSGSFAAIRSEHLLQPIHVVPSSIKSDISLLLPYKPIEKELQRQIQLLRGRVLEKSLAASDKKGSSKAEQQYANYKTSPELMSEIMRKAWQQVEAISQKDKTLDVVFISQNRHLYCHSAILICRSQMFEQLIDKADPEFKLLGNITVIRHDKRIEVHFGSCEPLSLLLMIKYIYTDKYEYPTQYSIYSPDFWNSTNIEKIQSDLIALAKSFHLPYLLSSVESPFNQQPAPSLILDLGNIFDRYPPNVVLKTKTRDILCHEIILRQRCKFFYNLFSLESVWMLEKKKKQKVLEVDFQFLTGDVAEVIIRFLYLDLDSHSLLTGFEKETEDETIQFLMEILQEADALLLKRLKSIVENLLVQFIKVRTALRILECASSSWAQNLQQSCLTFIKVNLTVFMCSGALDCLSDFLMVELEQHIQQSQAKKLPFAYPTSFNCTWNVDCSHSNDDEFLVTVYSLMRGNETTISPSLETLVTIHPEIPLVSQKLQKAPEKQQRDVCNLTETAQKDHTQSWIFNSESSLV